MKLLSTLITALALIASVFTAPRALAYDIEFNGTELGIYGAYFYSSNEALIHLSDGANTLLLDFYLSEPNVIEGTFTESNLDSYSHYQTYGNGFSRVEFTIVGDISKFEITGEGVLSSSGQSIWFHYSNLTKEQETFVFNTNTFKEAPYYSSMYGGYTMTFENETKYCTINLKNGAQFNGNISIEDCYTASIRNKDNTGYVYFSEITLTISGDPTRAREIHGSGTLSNGDLVTIDHSDLSEQVNITTAQYATYYNPYKDVVLPTGVEGYVAYIADNAFHFEKVYYAGDAVPAGNAIVINGASGKHTFNYTTGGNDPENNDLIGTTASITASDMASGEYAAGYKFYALALDRETGLPESIGFYWLADEGAAFNLGAGKAYLPVEDGSIATSRGFSFNDALGINDVKAEKEPGVMYNVNGQRVKEAKGLVVREGKMMFVK